MYVPDSLLTVIDVKEETWITEDWLRQKVMSYRSSDDVFCDAFMIGVVFTQGTRMPKVSAEASDYMKSLGNTWFKITAARQSPGPYLTFGGQLFEVYRVYDDTQGAFMTGIFPSNEL